MNLVADIAAKTVTIDGLALHCDVPLVPAWIAVVRWHGETLYGHITPVPGTADGGDFRDPSLVAPYIAAWRATMQMRIDALAADQASEAAAFQKWIGDQAALTKQQQASAAKPAAKTK
jgi:hypothetical protein